MVICVWFGRKSNRWTTQLNDMILDILSLFLSFPKKIISSSYETTGKKKKKKIISGSVNFFSSPHRCSRWYFLGNPSKTHTLSLTRTHFISTALFVRRLLNFPALTRTGSTSHVHCRVRRALAFVYSIVCCFIVSFFFVRLGMLSTKKEPICAMKL